jgi:hypothetical protein
MVGAGDGAAVACPLPAARTITTVVATVVAVGGVVVGGVIG